MALSASFEYLCYGSTVIINTEDLVIFACLNFREYLILGLHCHYYKTKFEVSGEDFWYVGYFQVDNGQVKIFLI